jgi:hypothetical protein
VSMQGCILAADVLPPRWLCMQSQDRHEGMGQTVCFVVRVEARLYRRTVL